MRKKFILFLWIALATSVVVVGGVFCLIWNGVIGYMPDMKDLQNPISRFATQIHSSDGKVLGTWNINKSNRIPVAYSNLSPHLVHALVATEDARFYEHSAIDFYAVGRAVVKRGL